MTSPSLALRLQRNLYLKEHLKELEALTGRVVRAEELGSHEQLVALRQSSQKFHDDQRVIHCEILFSEKTSERFKRFLQRLKVANPSPIYILAPRVESCGTLLVSSLDEIKFDFDFEINEDGILIFVTNDFEDSLLLDFSIAPTGEQMLQIETQGTNWAKVIY